MNSPFLFLSKYFDTRKNFVCLPHTNFYEKVYLKQSLKFRLKIDDHFSQIEFLSVAARKSVLFPAVNFW